MPHSDLGDRLAAAGSTTETLDERRRQADIHARLFGNTTPVYIGRYRVHERLGAGAMGTVFAAHDDRLNRSVAIKVLTDRSEAGQALTLREARGLAQLTHPNVVRIYEADTDGERVFIVMESLQGETLADWPSERSQAEILSAYLAAGRGLAAVHAAGLVHRDFKPANVMVDDQGHARLIDFGLARHTDDHPTTAPADAPRSMTVTMTGALVGTPAYMAPELLAGRSATPRSDQFAFCAALYESLLAERPFQGDSIPVLQAEMTVGPPLQLSRLPARIAHVIARGLAVDPADRWPDMPTLLVALTRVKPRSRWPFVLLVLGLASGLGWTLWPTDTTRSATSPGTPAPGTASPPTVRPLPERPSLAAAVLAARDTDAEWSAAAQTTLSRPIVRGEFGRFPGPPVELYATRDAQHPALYARMPDERWRPAEPDGTGAPIAWSTLVAKCALEDAAAGVDGDAPFVVCHRDGRLKRGPDTWVFTHADGTVGAPLIVPAGAVWWANGDLIVTQADGQLARQPLMGGAAPTAPAALHDIQYLAGRDGAVLATRADGQVFIWRPGQAPWPLTMVQGRTILRVAPRARWFAIMAGSRLQLYADESATPLTLPGSWRQPMAFDPGGRWLALVSTEGELTIWDLMTRTAIRIPGLDAATLAWQPAGLFVGLRDGCVLRFNVDGLTGERLGRHAARVWSGEMAPDRRRWVTAGMDGTAKIWSLDAPPITLRGHERGVFTARFSPDGRHVATGSSDGTARLWPLDGGQPVVFPGHETWAYALAFSPDGAHLATASKTGVVRAWPTDGGPPQVLAEAGSPKSMRRVHALAYAPDGAWLTMGVKSGRVRRLSTRGLPPQALPPHAYDAHLFYDAQGRLVTYGTDPQIRIFAPHGSALLGTIDLASPVRFVVASGDALAWTTTAGDVWIKLDDDAAPQTLGKISGQAEMLAFDASAARLIVGSSSGQLAIWRLADGHRTDLAGHLDGVRFVGFDANGDAVSAGVDGHVTRWPLAADEPSLRARLRAATDLCLDAAQRAQWLTTDEADRLRCEQRKPSPIQRLPSARD